MTALRRQMDNDMVVRGMAAKTRKAYLAAVTGLARYYRRSPDQISDAEVQTYLLSLIQERKRAWSTCNIAVHGLRFFYHVTLKRDRATFSIPASRQPFPVAQTGGLRAEGFEVIADHLVDETLRRNPRLICSRW